MNYQNFKAIEPVSFFKGVAREALRGRWTLALVAGFFYTVLLNIPILVFDEIFGIPIDSDQFASLFGLNSQEMMSVFESQGYADGINMSLPSPISGIYGLLTTAAFTLGFSILAIHIVRRAEADAGMVFSGFSNYFRSLGVMILIGLICILWILICTVPVVLIATINSSLAALMAVPLSITAIVLVIVISFRYSMSYFILADNPKIGVFECLKRSKMMMNGNKGKLFLLYLSFIGWYILYFIVSMVFGTIALIFLGDDFNLIGQIVTNLIFAIPLGILISYLYVSTASFYEKVSGISSGMFNLSQNIDDDDENPENGRNGNQNRIE